MGLVTVMSNLVLRGPIPWKWGESRVNGGSARVKRCSVIGGCRTFSYLTIWSIKRVFTPRYFFKNTVAKVFHEHLFFAFHILDNDVLNGWVSVELENMLAFHDAGPAVLVPHLHQDSTKDWLG